MEQTKEKVARWIAGDIVFSKNPSHSLRRWREMFGMSQSLLALALGVSPSVISDYESGRRKSPGTEMVKKIVSALLEHDLKSGGKMVLSLSRVLGVSLPSDTVIDMKELNSAVSVAEFCRLVNAELVTCSHLSDRKLFGYTIINSQNAILSLSADDFKRLYGMTSERALIFTGVGTGRSPLVAIKVAGIVPGLVVLHGSLKELDALAAKIAEQLHLPVAISRLRRAEDLVERLKPLE